MTIKMFLLSILSYDCTSYTMKHISTTCGKYYWSKCYEAHQEKVLEHMIGDYSHHTTTNTQNAMYSTIFYKSL
jgi:hypothetical protein